MGQEQWLEWIEWKGGECPIPHATAGEWQAKSVPGGNGAPQSHVDYCTKRHDANDGLDCCWQHAPGKWPIDAYRVRLTAQQPATTVGDGVDENARMVERDEPTKAAQPVPSDPIAALWQAIGAYSVQVSETGECAPPAELLAAVKAIEQALTPPAPAKPEPKAADFSAVAPLERLGATRWGVQ